MKNKLLLLAFLAGQLIPVYNQQLINQYSDGGTPWSYTHQLANPQVDFVTMPSFDVEAMNAEDAANETNKNIPFRFGYNHYVSYNLNNSGTWTPTEDGGRVWRLGISSPGALSINIALQYVSIPDGGKFFIYNESKTILLGGFTQAHIAPDDLSFGSELVDGDRIIVEYYEPAHAAGTSSLEIFRITHRYRQISEYLVKNFGESESCENNVNCPIGAPYANQKRSVVCLVSGGSGFCTGALVNNTCNDGTPYILTANHCGSSGFGSWVFRFNWESSGCTTGSNPSSNSVSGGSQRAANAGSDMSLVEMTAANVKNTIKGYNVYYAGWDRTNTPSVNQVAIHHPSGDIKKISFATGTASTVTMSGATCWKTGTWTDGVTEPGSSGSPLFNTSGLIIGQLFGGPSQCACEGNSSCGYDNYGKFFTSWTGGGSNSTRLSNWLAPASCGTAPNTLQGYDPNNVSGVGIEDPADAMNINVYPNPSSGYIVVDNADFADDTYTISIINITGEVVWMANANTPTYTINTTGYAEGLYLVKVSQGKNAATRRIIMTR